MRNLFLLLLLGNICLGLWVYTQEKVAREAAVQRVPSVNAKPLVLLSELSASEIQKARPRPAPSPAPPPQSAPEIVVEAVAEDVEPEAEVLAEDAAVEVPQDNVLAEPAPDSASAPEAEPALVPELACYTLGPFADKAKSQRALGLLQALGAQSSQRASKEQVPYGYRVFIPPLSSREQAYKVADSLRSAGVKDYFVITNPNDKLNGVSLGLFKQRTGAIKRVAQLRNMDYQASIEVRYKDKDIYWLDYSAAVGVVDAQVLLEAGEGVTGMQHLARDCDAQDEKN